MRAGGDELSARIGELRRLTFMYCDVVGSTELSARRDPETYRELMRRYREVCRDVIEKRFEGHIVHIKGDGVLATFGFPVAHENDAERGVRAGLALVRAVRDLSADPEAADEPLEVRIAVHHGPVYVDLDEDDIYGLAANVGARLQTLADPGTVVVSDEVRGLVTGLFVIEPGAPQRVKGVAEPLQPFRVVSECPPLARRAWTTPLVEREIELDRLREAWARVSSGRADRLTALLISGDAGVGKSRLVAALVDEVGAGDAPVVELHGSPFHVDAGLHPVRTLVEDRCDLRDDADPAERLERVAEELTDLGLDPAEDVPLLAPVLGIGPNAGYQPAAAEGRKLEGQIAGAALRYIIACARGRPTIVVAENLHWFDGSTRELLDDLVRSGPATVLVIGTSRNRDDARWEAIELDPLTLSGCIAVIDALAEGLTEDDRLALAARSDGIPLFLEELVRGTRLEDRPRRDDAAPVPGSVPAALYEPLVARLYATASALPVAAAAAAAGQQVERSLLAATIPLPDEELDSTLRDLVDGQILVPIAGRARCYQFRHELLREVAYELQPPSWRRKVHSRLCDFLSRDEPGDWRVLASHFERAQRNYEAAVAYQHTAEAARRRGALEEARSHLTRAIELVMPLSPGAARDHLEVQLRLRRGFLAMSTGGAASAEASADFDRCLEVASTDPSSDDMFSSLISVWAYDLSRADLDRARHVSETLRVALEDGRDYFHPQNLAGFGMLDWFAGNFASAIRILTAAAEDLAAMGREEEVAAAWFVPNDPTVAIHVHLALARFMMADVPGAAESLARGRAVAAALDFPQAPWSAAYANWLGSWMWIEAGRLDLAEEALDDLHFSSARHGFDSWELIAATQTAVLDASSALRSGSRDPAELSDHAEAISAYVELWQALGLRVFLPFYLTTIGALLAASGEVEPARRRFEESLRLGAETGMRFYDAETMRLSAHLAPGREDVISRLREALRLADAQAARPFELRIALDLRDLLGSDPGGDRPSS